MIGAVERFLSSHGVSKRAIDQRHGSAREAIENGPSGTICSANQMPGRSTPPSSSARTSAAAPIAVTSAWPCPRLTRTVPCHDLDDETIPIVTGVALRSQPTRRLKRASARVATHQRRHPKLDEHRKRTSEPRRIKRQPWRGVGQCFRKSDLVGERKR